MARTYGFGIVGGGMIGNSHAQAIKQLPNARLAAVCDSVPAAAEKFGGTCGVPGLCNIEELLSRKDIDIITVATPSGTHADIAIAAAKHGKHCIIEKPIDVTLAKIDRAIAAHDTAGTQLGGIFNMRYMPTARLFKQAVDEGRFGR